MQKSNNKIAITDTKSNNSRKVNKKVTNKMSKNPKPAAASSSTSPPDNYRESPQNARLDTSESEEESVSEVMEVSRRQFATPLWHSARPSRKSCTNAMSEKNE